MSMVPLQKMRKAEGKKTIKMQNTHNVPPFYPIFSEEEKGFFVLFCFE